MSVRTISILCLITGLCSVLPAAEQSEALLPGIREVMKEAFSEVKPLGKRFSYGYTWGEYFMAKGPEDKQVEKYGVTREMHGTLDSGIDFIILAAYNVSLRKRAEENIDNSIFPSYPTNMYVIIGTKKPKEDWKASVHSEHIKGEVRGMFGPERGRLVSLLSGKKVQLECLYSAYTQDEEKIGRHVYKKIYDIPSGKKIFSALILQVYNFDKDTLRSWKFSFIRQDKAPSVITRQEEGKREIEYYTYNGETYTFDRIETSAEKKPELLGSRRDYYEKMLRNPEYEEPEGTFQVDVIPGVAKIERYHITEKENLMAVKAAYPEADIIRHKKNRLYTVIKDGKEQTVFLKNADKVILKDGRKIITGLVFSEKIISQGYRKILFENANKRKYIQGYYVVVTKKKKSDLMVYKHTLTKNNIYYHGSQHPIIRVPQEGIFQILKNTEYKSEGENIVLSEGYILCYEITRPRLVLKVPTTVKKIIEGKKLSDRVFDGPANYKWIDKDFDNNAEFVLYDKVKIRFIYRSEDKILPVFLYKYQNGVFKYWKHGAIDIEENKNKKDKYVPEAISPNIEAEVHVVDKYGDGIKGVEVAFELVRWNINILRMNEEPSKVIVAKRKSTDEKGYAKAKGRCTKITVTINREGYERYQKSYDLLKEPLPDVIEVKLKKKEK